MIKKVSMHIEILLNENTTPATNLEICWASFNMPETKWWKYDKESVRQKSKPKNLMRVALAYPQTNQITLQYGMIVVAFWGVVLNVGSMESSRKKHKQNTNEFTARCALGE